jgi:WD40 repeat protein
VLYDAQDGKSLARFDQCKSAPPDAVFSPDGKQIATTTGDDNVVKVWRVSTLRGESPSASPFDNRASDSRGS